VSYETRRYETKDGTIILAGQKWQAFDGAFGTVIVMGIQKRDPSLYGNDGADVKLGRPMANVIMSGTGPSLALSAEEYTVSVERFVESFTRHDSNRYGLTPLIYVTAVNGDGECAVGGVCEVCPGSTDDCPVVKASDYRP